MASKLTCPECRAVLRPAREVPDGSSITCPKCGTAFTTGRAVVDSPAPAAVKATRARVIDDDDDDDDDYDRPVRRRPKAKQKPKSNAVAIIAVVVGLVVLLGGGAVAAVLFFFDQSKPVASGPVDKTDFNRTPPPGFPPDLVPKLPQDPGPPVTKDTKGGGAKAGTPSGKVGLNVGDTAMEIEAEDLDGKKFKLSDYRGKVVVLDFWGDW